MRRPRARAFFVLWQFTCCALAIHQTCAQEDYAEFLADALQLLADLDLGRLEVHVVPPKAALDDVVSSEKANVLIAVRVLSALEREPRE